MSMTHGEEYGADPMTFVDYLERFFRPYKNRPRLKEEVEEALRRLGVKGRECKVVASQAEETCKGRT